MASPFANAGLGNFGNESKYYSEPTEMSGILQGLKAAGVVALKNMIGIPAPASAPVVPNVSGVSSAPVVSNVQAGFPAIPTLVQPTTNDFVHPELDLASQTNIYGK